MLQMLDLKDNEVGWVLKHLGHSMNVHENYYRMMHSVIERAKVAKLLILSDMGKVGEYAGKNIDQINFDGK